MVGKRRHPGGNAAPLPRQDKPDELEDGLSIPARKTFSGKEESRKQSRKSVKICWLNEQEETLKMSQAELSSVRAWAWQKQKDHSHKEETLKMSQAELSSVRAWAWQKQKDHSHSVAEMLPSERPKQLSLDVYFSMKERMGMACADAESRSNQCTLLMADAAAAKSEVQAYFSERILMACADAESRSNQCALLMADAAAKSAVVQARLSWMENVRDMTSSLARSNLLKAQGLPKWIILEGRALAWSQCRRRGRKEHSRAVGLASVCLRCVATFSFSEAFAATCGKRSCRLGGCPNLQADEPMSDRLIGLWTGHVDGHYMRSTDK